LRASLLFSMTKCSLMVLFVSWPWPGINLFFFLWDLGLNSGVHTYKAGSCKAGTLPLKLYLQSILVWLFWRWGLENYLPRLALSLL
jgi:hypothetical protein